MNTIYIDVNKREIIIKDKKDKIINKYSNISTKNKRGIKKSIKLFMVALNKVFLINRYNDSEYLFNINDKELVDIIKLENNSFREIINKDWHNIYDFNTVSQLGTFLVFLKKIENKNVFYWERDEIFELKDKKEELYKEQSICDTEIQDILHSIQVLKEEELTDVNCISLIYKIREIRKKRNKIKDKIREIERKERSIRYEK